MTSAELKHRVKLQEWAARNGTAENAGGASAPMLNDFTGADKVYIACGYADLRKGIDGLARLVQQQFALDPFANTLFLFCLPHSVV